MLLRDKILIFVRKKKNLEIFNNAEHTKQSIFLTKNRNSNLKTELDLKLW